MIIKTFKIKELKSSEYNPREITKESLDKLKKSIKVFGYIEPIILNEKTGLVVGGNQRLRALKELYGPNHKIDVVVVNLTDEQEKALNIALNKISGQWDYDKLADIFGGFKEIKFNDIDLTGFNDIEISNILIKNDEFSRPDFTDLIDKFKPDKKVMNKDENWFYIEYYKDDKRFAEVKDLIKMKDKFHEIDNDWFYDLLKEARKK